MCVRSMSDGPPACEMSMCGMKIIEPPCGHKFCKGCLGRQFTTGNMVCGICRADITDFLMAMFGEAGSETPLQDAEQDDMVRMLTERVTTLEAKNAELQEQVDVAAAAGINVDPRAVSRLYFLACCTVHSSRVTRLCVCTPGGQPRPGFPRRPAPSCVGCT